MSTTEFGEKPIRIGNRVFGYDLDKENFTKIAVCGAV